MDTKKSTTIKKIRKLNWGAADYKLVSKKFDQIVDTLNQMAEILNGKACHAPKWKVPAGMTIAALDDAAAAVAYVGDDDET